MLIRQTPKNKENYIMVDSKVSQILQENGFYPKYMDDEFIYYVKSDEIIEFMSKEGLK
jgi:hypothetical protein